MDCCNFQFPPGIVVIAGDWESSRSVEFWSPTDPEEGSCVLGEYPRQVLRPTANLVSGQMVVCYELSCEIYNGGEWNHLVTPLLKQLEPAPEERVWEIMIFVRHSPRLSGKI